VVASENHWFQSGMYARVVFGILFAVGYVVLAYDLLAIGRRAALAAPPQPSAA
jgi:nitric oxide reductase subunit B